MTKIHKRRIRIGKRNGETTARRDRNGGKRSSGVFGLDSEYYSTTEELVLILESHDKTICRHGDVLKS